MKDEKIKTSGWRNPDSQTDRSRQMNQGRQIEQGKQIVQGR